VILSKVRRGERSRDGFRGDGRRKEDEERVEEKVDDLGYEPPALGLVLAHESAEEETRREVPGATDPRLREVLSDEEHRCRRDGVREIRRRPDHADQSEERELSRAGPGLRRWIERTASDTPNKVLLHKRELLDVVGRGREWVGVREGEEGWKERVDGGEGLGGWLGREVKNVVEEDVGEYLWAS
jgi:hypothetical protein